MDLCNIFDRIYVFVYGKEKNIMKKVLYATVIFIFSCDDGYPKKNRPKQLTGNVAISIPDSTMHLRFEEPLEEKWIKSHSREVYYDTLPELGWYSRIPTDSIKYYANKKEVVVYGQKAKVIRRAVIR